MYSRHSCGFFARSVFRRMLRERGLQLPHFGLHSLHEEPVNRHAHQWLPFGDQGRDCLLELLAIPLVDDGLPLFFAGSRAHLKKHVVCESN